MSLSRKLMVLVLPIAMLFVGFSSAAATPATGHQVVVSGPVSFTILADQCPELPAGVSISGSGQSMSVINTRTLKDGSVETRINNVIKGDATDSNGGAHTFTYENFSTDLALSSGVHQISMTDTFVLNGPGPQYSAGFNWRWTYTEPESYWPPVDNWEQISTRGDIFACDPL
jgi:hypothetical protein